MAAEHTTALLLTGIRKSFVTGIVRRRSRPALRDLSFAVPRGGIFGYLGHNGSGKTTTLKIVMGLVRADAGEIRVLGHRLEERAWRARTGYLPEHPYLYDYLTPREYLEYAGRLFGMPSARRRERTALLLERVGLTRSADVPMRRFSKGMVQRAGIAQALVNDPELVVLDEPMSGLDPIGRRMVRELILSLRDEGKTVLFSTHILSDAETLCDRVALLRGGRLVAVGALGDILTVDVEHMEVIAGGLPDPLPAGLGAVVSAAGRLGERWRLHVTEEHLPAAVAGVAQGGGRILSVMPVRRSLEDLFLAEMGEGAARWEVED